MNDELDREMEDLTPEDIAWLEESPGVCSDCLFNAEVGLPVPCNGCAGL